MSLSLTFSDPILTKKKKNNHPIILPRQVYVMEQEVEFFSM